MPSESSNFYTVAISINVFAFLKSPSISEKNAIICMVGKFGSASAGLVYCDGTSTYFELL